ncbi:MAG: 23S rRNA (guanosine(2251)-2'-O)-methyltransferase RlmB [Alphaproteobacteria bacterium]|nr:23S rRNA (guanosine(2251)-2'-O)-methyltransferase RlmB [Alphaproteobacteria bacterium]
MSKGKHQSGRGGFGSRHGADGGGGNRGKSGQKPGPKGGFGGKPARAGKPVRFEKPERPKRPERQPSHSDRAFRPDRPERPFRQERPARPPREERRDFSGHTDSGRPEAGGNRVWLYGIHPVLAALANPNRKILRIAVSGEVEATIGPRIATLADGHPTGLPDVEIVSRESLDRMLPRAAVHQGLAALAEGLEDPDLEDIVRATDGHDIARVMVLDQVTDPHNIGAILRSCAGFGVAAVILPERHSPAATAVMAKAASGALERVPFVRVVNLARALDRLKAAGFWCVGLAGEAQTPINQADLTGKIALVVGAEGEGLRRLTRERCDLLVRIPMEKGVESLNVSNAAAIALYELARRTVV